MECPPINKIFTIKIIYHMNLYSFTIERKGEMKFALDIPAKP